MKLQKLVAMLSCCILVLSATFSVAQEQPEPDERSSPVLDNDGQPIVAGALYYIKPVNRDDGGALTVVTRNKGQECPKFVGQAQDPEAEGTPVNFTGAVKEDWEVIITFQGSTSCPQRPTWKSGVEVTGTGRSLIEIGGEVLGEVLFKITSYNGVYYIVVCALRNEDCKLTGIVGENGVRLLAEGGPAVPFQFERLTE